MTVAKKKAKEEKKKIEEEKRCEWECREKENYALAVKLV